jgi:hypothetical protein
MRSVDRKPALVDDLTSKPSVAFVIRLTRRVWLGRNDRESHLSGIGHIEDGRDWRAGWLTMVTPSDGLTVSRRWAETNRSSAGAPPGPARCRRALAPAALLRRTAIRAPEVAPVGASWTSWMPVPRWIHGRSPGAATLVPAGPRCGACGKRGMG